MPDPVDSFYIGWQERMPRRHGRFVGRLVLGLLLGAAGLAALLTSLQAPFQPGRFEFGLPRTFEGTVRHLPYPRFVVDGPDGTPAADWALVGAFKHGGDADVAGFDGRRIRLSGTLIYRDDQTMLEVVPGSVRAIEGPAAPAPRRLSLGRHTLVGEIVDSKCWFGVMKPGATKPHRACASLCLLGGIPPVLLLRHADGSASHLLLVGPGGKAIGPQLLDVVAEPVRVSGELILDGEVAILEIEAGTVERLGR